MRILLALAVMAATGCETDNTVYELTRARVQQQHQQPFKPKLQPGTDRLGHAPTPVAYESAPAQASTGSSVLPVVVTAPGSGTTMATQIGNTTVVSQFGGYRPIYTPPPVPINTGNNTPTVYTIPLQQP